MKGCQATRILFSLALLAVPLRASGTEIPEPATRVKAELGQGYSSERQAFGGICVRTASEQNRFAGSPSATLNFEQSLTQDQLSKELGFSVGARARFGVVSVAAAAQFQSASASSATSLVSIYSADYTFKSAALSTYELTDLGKTLAPNFERWGQTCGDEMVVQVDYGARLFFSIRLDFSSTEDRNSFAASFNISGPVYGAEGTFKQASERFQKRVKVTINVLQLGGDVTQVSRVFNFDGGPEVRMGFVSCTLGDFDKCALVLSQAIGYATDTSDPGSFASQLKRFTEQTQPDSPVGLATLRYHTDRYPNRGIFVQPNPILTAGIKEARKVLTDRFEENLDLYLSSDRLLNRVSRFTPQQAQNLQQLNGSARQNLDRIETAAATCFEGQLTGCPDEVRRLQDELRPVNPSYLTVIPSTFAQICDLHQKAGQQMDAGTTIGALIENAKSTAPGNFLPEGSVDVCGAADAILTRASRIFISGKNIKDVSAFRFLPQLQRLTLHYNQIEDAAPLAELKELTFLDLSDNKIQNASSLRNLEKLRTLILINNFRSLRCPFTDATRCHLGYYLDGSQFSRLDDRSFPTRRPCAVASSEGGALVASYHLVPVDPKPSTRREIHVERFTTDGVRDQLTKNTTLSNPDHPTESGSGSACSAVQISPNQVLVVGTTEQHLVDLTAREVRQVWPLGAGVSIARTAGVSEIPSTMRLNDGRVFVFGRTPFVMRPGDPKPKVLGVDGGTPSLVPRERATLALLRDGRVLITGGQMVGTGSAPKAYSNLVEIFDPATDAITRVGSMEDPRVDHAAVVLGDGRVLLGGGYNRGADGRDMIIRLSELFDPTTNSVFLTREPMINSRSGHTATLLPNGKVLIAGGERAGKAILGTDRAEIYDPDADGYYRIGARLNNERSQHVAFRVRDGAVVLYGGNNRSETGGNLFVSGRSAEIYIAP